MSSKLEELLAVMLEQNKIFQDQYRSTQAHIDSLMTATLSLVNDLHHKIVINNPIRYRNSTACTG